MAKLWSIPSKYIDDRRLLRQHQSIHKLLTACTKKFDAAASGRLYNFGGYLIWRHYEVVGEMLVRGMNHSSYVEGLWKQIPTSRKLIRFRFYRKEILQDLKELQLKHRNAPTTSSSYGRIPLHQYDITKDELGEMVDKVALTGFPKDIFLV